MHVMIATDGSLDAAKSAKIATRLAHDSGKVTVFTVVEVPRGLLDDMRSAAGDKAADKARQIGSEHRTTQAPNAPVSQWVGDDAVVSQYVKGKVKDRTASLVTALEATGVEFSVLGEEGESAARSVLEATRSHGIDVLCIGTHGLGRFEGLLGSLSTKLVRLAPCSVILVR